MYSFDLMCRLIDSFGYLYLLSERQKILNTTYPLCFCLHNQLCLLKLTSPGLGTTNGDNEDEIVQGLSVV